MGGSPGGPDPPKFSLIDLESIKLPAEGAKTL